MGTILIPILQRRKLIGTQRDEVNFPKVTQQDSGGVWMLNTGRVPKPIDLYEDVSQGIYVGGSRK